MTLLKLEFGSSVFKFILSIIIMQFYLSNPFENRPKVLYCSTQAHYPLMWAMYIISFILHSLFSPKPASPCYIWKPKLTLFISPFDSFKNTIHILCSKFTTVAYMYQMFENIQLGYRYSSETFSLSVSLQIASFKYAVITFLMQNLKLGKASLNSKSQTNRRIKTSPCIPICISLFLSLHACMFISPLSSQSSKAILASSECSYSNISKVSLLLAQCSFKWGSRTISSCAVGFSSQQRAAETSLGHF